MKIKVNTKTAALCGILVLATSLSAGQSQSKSSQIYKNGVLFGKVLDDQGKPVSGAIVAIEDSRGKVAAWTQTREDGLYAIAANPIDLLSLRPAHHRGLFESCIRAVGDLVLTPIKIVGDAVTNPGKTIGSGLVAVADGTPTPLAAKAAAGLTGISSPEDTERQAQDLAARMAVSGAPGGQRPTHQKGQVTVLVSAKGYQDACSADSVYWLEPPIEDKDRPIGVQAWLETIQLAPTGSKLKSGVKDQALVLSDGQASPSLVPAGGTVHLTAKIQVDPGPEFPRRVFAREAKKDVVIELKPSGGGLYAGDLPIDPHTPPGVTTITIGALRTQPLNVQLDPKKEDPLLLFVKQTDDMKAGKPYEYDPLIMASQNRLDVQVRVLKPKGK